MINSKILLKLQQYDTTLVAVTKTVGVEKMQALYTQGVRHFGENRVDVFLEKVEYFQENADIKWHYIGAIQSRQVKKIINYVDYLHALSTSSVAKEIEKQAENPVKCFIQVNCSGEVQKSGLNPEEVARFYQEMQQYSKIEIVGLMTMAAYTENEEEIRNCFSQLELLRNEINPNLKLSMGMSNDYQIAIECGSDFLRVGSVLFK